MSYADSVIRSDFLIHWTGKDIDNRFDMDWYDKPDQRALNDATEEEYLQRLRNILKFGLWMTEEPSSPMLAGVSVPIAPKCCFTELKLSESRKHAREYGRLGIGVKRPFLFRRQGRPVVYFGFDEDRNNDLLLRACRKDLEDKTLLNFFKPMNSMKAKRSFPLYDYDYYSESEWRLIFTDDLLGDPELLVDPRDPSNENQHKYYQSLSAAEQSKLKYLIPLDDWFAMIIYPCASLREKARTDTTIRAEIERVKSNIVESGIWPIEAHLADCRHF